MLPFLIFVYEKFFLLLNPEVILLNGAIHEQSISTKIIDTAVEFSLEKNQPRLNLTGTMARILGFSQNYCDTLYCFK